MSDVKIMRELSGFNGRACLVELAGKFYVVSSANAAFTGPETLVFPATADGKVSDWLEVAGGRGISREEAIEDLARTVAAPKIIKATPEDAGCYVDGHWGQYAVAHMINRAEEFGYGSAVHFGQGVTDELAEQQAIVHLADRHIAAIGPSDAPGLTDAEYEALSEASDEVEAWLNEHVAPEGYSFGWFEGEFYLWSDEAWDEPYA